MQALVDRVRAEGEAALAAERTEKLAMQDSYEKVAVTALNLIATVRHSGAFLSYLVLCVWMIDRGRAGLRE